MMEVQKMSDDLIYLDSYILQQDMRIRLPKSVLANMEVQKGKSRFNIYFDKKNKCLVLRVGDLEEEEK